MNYYSIPPTSDEIWHHGIKGMRWGVRRYQNEDGSLTPAGEKRYDAYKTQEPSTLHGKNRKLYKQGLKLAKKGVFRQTELKDQLDKLVEKQADYARKNFSKYRGDGHKEYLKNMTSKDPKWRKINEELGKAEREYMALRQSQYNKKKKRRNKTLSFLTKVQTQQRKPKVYVPIRF